jgi:hypothetical protein
VKPLERNGVLGDKKDGPRGVTSTRPALEHNADVGGRAMSRCGHSGDSPQKVKHRKVIDVDLVRRILDYCPATGAMRWKPRPMSLFQCLRTGRGWNTKFAGKEASLTLIAGYPTICIYDKRFLAHRVAWAIYYGAQPPEILDHIDRDRTNMKISNLRAVNDVENSKNQSVRSDNKVGITGLWALKPKGRGARWAVVIGNKKGIIYKRKFQCLGKALEDRKLQYNARGFDENHGQRPDRARGARA